jgi:hypothetical protein
MTTVRSLLNKIPEYTTVMSAAAREGWLVPLIEAHLTPCSIMEAQDILRSMDLPADLKLRFRNRRGRARFNPEHRRYGIYLAATPGVSFGGLRAGLVLHEAAHVWDHQKRGRFSHGPTYRRALRDAILETAWRPCVMGKSVKEIYYRHRGPYEFLLSSRNAKGEDVTTHHVGPFNMQEAHSTAIDLVTKPGGNIFAVWVFSKTEGQFTGAFYKRNDDQRAEVYAPWHELEEPDGPGTTAEKPDADRGVELPDEREAPALLPEREEPLPAMDDSVDASLPEGTVPGGGPVRDLPPQEPAQPRVKRIGPPRRTGRALELGAAEGWPKSEAAQIVRTFMEGKRLTSVEIVAAIGAELTGLGVQFPASLISRLKQGGFLREVTEE